MFDQPAPAPPPGPAAPQAGGDLCRQVIDELLTIGLDVARLVGKRATEEAACLPAPDGGGTVLTLAAAYDRVARALRRTVLLRKHLDKPARTPAADRAAARRRIIRAVEDKIGREGKQGAEAGRLRAELLERLDGPDLEDDIATRPAAEIITEICRDLGLDTPPFAPAPLRRTPADIAALCALAAKPRQPEHPAKPPQPHGPARPRHIEPGAAPNQSATVAKPPRPALVPPPSPTDPAERASAALCRLLAATEPI